MSSDSVTALSAAYSLLMSLGSQGLFGLPYPVRRIRFIFHGPAGQVERQLIRRAARGRIPRDCERFCKGELVRRVPWSQGNRPASMLQPQVRIPRAGRPPRRSQVDQRKGSVGAALLDFVESR